MRQLSLIVFIAVALSVQARALPENRGSARGTGATARPKMTPFRGGTAVAKHGSVYVMYSDGRAQVRATHPPAGYADSPPVSCGNGARIAFVRSNARSGRPEIWVAVADRSGRIRERAIRRRFWTIPQQNGPDLRLRFNRARTIEVLAPGGRMMRLTLKGETCDAAGQPVVR